MPQLATKQPKRSFQFWLGFSLGILTTLVSLCVLFVWTVFFGFGIHRNPPEALNKNLTVTEIKATEVPTASIQSQPCKVSDAPQVEAASVFTNDPLSTEEIEVPQLFTDICDEYVMSENMSLIDYQSSTGTLILKKNFEGVSTFTPIFASRGKYPGWSYTLKAVTKEGRVYFEYGGHDYFGNNRPGNLLYKVKLGSN